MPENSEARRPVKEMRLVIAGPYRSTSPLAGDAEELWLSVGITKMQNIHVDLVN